MSTHRNTFIIAALILLRANLWAFGEWKENARAMDISGGEDHTLVLTANNWVWACGDNNWGQLGIGNSLDRYTLVRVHDANDLVGLADVNDVDAGWTHSLALDVNSMVWAWGRNEEGQLGDGTAGSSSTPLQVHGVDDEGFLQYIITISAGRSGLHSLAVDANGYVYGWGYNEYGQCGNDANACDELTPVYVRRGEQPVDPNDANDYLKHVVAISAGSNNSIALEADLSADPNSLFEGCVYTWGCNMWGEEPFDTMITDGWGLLGNGSGSAVIFSDTPVKVLRGEQDYNEPGQVYLEHVVAVSAGWDHLMALEKYEEYDSYLDLTDPCYIWPDPNYRGRVYTWGNNGNGWDSGGGRLGNGSATDGNSTPVLVLRGEQPPDYPNDTYPYLCHIVTISAGEGHSMALDVDGSVYCWGDNYHGQLGSGCDDPCATPVRVVGRDRNRNGIHDANEGYLENIWLSRQVTGIAWL